MVINKSLYVRIKLRWVALLLGVTIGIIPHVLPASPSSSHLKKNLSINDRFVIFSKNAFDAVSAIDQTKLSEMSDADSQNFFFKLRISVFEKNMDQVPVPSSGSLSDLYGEETNAAFEQILPFAASANKLDNFLQNFKQLDPNAMHRRIATMIHDYPQVFPSTEIDHRAIREQLYIRANSQELAYRTMSAAARINLLLEMFCDFIAMECNQLHTNYPEKDIDEVYSEIVSIALQQILPVAARHEHLWGFLAKFRKGNEIFLKEITKQLKRKFPDLLNLKSESIDAEAYWEEQADWILEKSRSVMRSYVELFQKQKLFEPLGSPI